MKRKFWPHFQLYTILSHIAPSIFSGWDTMIKTIFMQKKNAKSTCRTTANQKVSAHQNEKPVYKMREVFGDNRSDMVPQYFPHSVDWLSGKDPTSKAGVIGVVGSTPGSGRSPGGGNDNPLQYSHQENSMDRGAWWVTVHRVAESDMTEWLRTYVW